MALFGAHDDDEADVGDGVERLGGPGEDGLVRDLDELLAALLAEPLARAAGQDDRGGLGVLAHLALEPVLLRKRIHVEIIRSEREPAQHRRRIDRIDGLRHLDASPSLRP